MYNQTPYFPPPETKKPRKISLLGFLIFVPLFCLCCLSLSPALFSTYLNLVGEERVSTQVMQAMPVLLTALPTDFLPTLLPEIEQLTTATPQPVTLTKTVLSEAEQTAAKKNYQIIQKAEKPFNSFPDNALKFGLLKTIPTPYSNTTYQPALAEKKDFWVMDVNTIQYQKVTAQLKYENEIVYLWLDEDAALVPDETLRKIGETFAQKIYPQTRAMFGAETPLGFDGDSHIYVLFTDKGGAGLGGYFSSEDSYPKEVKKYSNEHKMFVISAQTANNSAEAVLSTLAHEFQHMIHWNTDQNEETWLNEGFAQLSSVINGYLSAREGAFFQNPNHQLNTWAMTFQETGPSYSTSYLFAKYLTQRLGKERIQKIVNSPLNGLESIDQTLEEMPLKFFEGGADSIFQDFAIANFINEKEKWHGDYSYADLPSLPEIKPIELGCSPLPQTFTVKQYGTQYFKINCPVGDYQINFNGNLTVPLVSAEPTSGNYMLWSNIGDQSDFTATREFDFTEIIAPITAEYQIWYALEDGFDFGYFEVSTDQRHWQIITTPHTTTKNDSGNNYGSGYTGKSSTWLTEKIDLSAYAGQKIWLRFEVFNDMAVHDEGLLIDDFKIKTDEEIWHNFETGLDGWQTNGFVRIENQIPQYYALSVLDFDQTGVLSIGKYHLEDTGQASPLLKFGNESDYTILAVNGLSRYTTQEATFSVAVTPF